MVKPSIFLDDRTFARFSRYLFIQGNFGGLLGLCLGFSLINLIEIVYFATVQLYYNFSSLSTESEAHPTKIDSNSIISKRLQRQTTHLIHLPIPYISSNQQQNIYLKWRVTMRCDNNNT